MSPNAPLGCVNLFEKWTADNAGSTARAPSRIRKSQAKFLRSLSKVPTVKGLKSASVKFFPRWIFLLCVQGILQLDLYFSASRYLFRNRDNVFAKIQDNVLKFAARYQFLATNTTKIFWALCRCLHTSATLQEIFRTFGERKGKLANYLLRPKGLYEEEDSAPPRVDYLIIHKIFPLT